MKTIRSILHLTRRLAVLSLLAGALPVHAQDFFPAAANVLLVNDRLQVPPRAPRGRPLNYNTRFYPFTVRSPGLYQMALVSQAREGNQNFFTGGVLTASQRSAFEQGKNPAQCTLVHFDSYPLWKKQLSPGTYWFGVRTQWTHRGEGTSATYTLRLDRIDPAPGAGGRTWFWDGDPDSRPFRDSPSFQSFRIKVGTDRKQTITVVKERDDVTTWLISEEQLNAWKAGIHLEPKHDFRGISSQVNMSSLPPGGYYLVCNRGGNAYSGGVMWVNTYKNR